MITDYELLMATGEFSESFTVLTNSYDFATHKFVYTLTAASESLTVGQFYRFKYRASNSLGSGTPSPSVTVTLGDLPSQPNKPYLIEQTNSSIKLGWIQASSPSNPVEQVKGYKLFRDNG